MHNPEQLKKILDNAKHNYQSAMTELASVGLNDEERKAVAQRANDAYLEYRKIDDSVTRCLVVKKLGDLFGC